MRSSRPRPRRFLVSLVLGAVLAGEVTGIALAHALAAPLPAGAIGSTAEKAAPAASVPAGSTARPTPNLVPASAVAGGREPLAAAELRQRTVPALRPTARPEARSGASGPASKPTRSKVAPARSTAPARSGGGSGARPTYHGTNHVWIPALGVDRSLKSFPCSRTRPPGSGVYRWGCAGGNNVYLLSHAWSTFKPLHDAYVRGALRKGMKVIYADGGGHVHTYSVIWWKVTAPTTAASWAWAPLAKPGMTLQTCVGSKSQYRLMVRLTRVA